MMINNQENRVSIKLSDGREIVAEFCDYDGSHPEIAICIQENGVAIQDICLVRPYCDDTDDDDEHQSIECLVWGDEYAEDYSHKFNIPQYTEE